MRFIQKSLHRLRDRTWKARKALVHMDRAIKEMELVQKNVSYPYEALKFSIDELKIYRRQDYFEYKTAMLFLEHYPIFTA